MSYLSNLLGLPEIGRIEALWSIPCAKPPTVWLRAVPSAIARAFITVIEPDDKELIRIVTGRSWLKNVKLAVEAAEEVKPTALGKFGEMVFPIAEVVDMALWYLFIVGVVEEGFADWSSTIYKMSGCISDPHTTLYQLENPIFGYAPNGGWQTCGLWSQIQPPGSSFTPPRFGIPSGGKCSAFAHVKTSGWFYPFEPYETRWYDSLNNEELQRNYISYEDQEQGFSSFNIAPGITPHPNGRTIEYQIRSTGKGIGTNLFQGGSMQVAITTLGAY